MDYLESAVYAAREAEKIVMKYFDKEKKIRNKAEVDLVTNADTESEKRIVEILQKKYPTHSFLLEEADNIINSSRHKWVIDPIDGTTSFAHNYPFFSISIALFENNKPMLGVVLAPYMKELFTAQKGKGAFLNNNRIKVSTVRKVKQSLISTGFPYERVSGGKDNMDYLKKIIKTAGGIRRSGSAALDVCYVAAGRVDGYWEIGLKMVDTAAAQLILTEAGGKVTRLNGNPIIDDYSVVVASNSIIHDELLRILGD